MFAIENLHKNWFYFFIFSILQEDSPTSRIYVAGGDCKIHLWDLEMKKIIVRSGDQ